MDWDRLELTLYKAAQEIHNRVNHWQREKEDSCAASSYQESRDNRLEKRREQRLELFELDYKHNSSLLSGIINHQHGWSTIVVKSVIFANGGGIIALLAFIGSLYKQNISTSDKWTNILVENCIHAMEYFTTGMFCGLLAAMCGYFVVWIGGMWLGRRVNIWRQYNEALNLAEHDAADVYEDLDEKLTAHWRSVGNERDSIYAEAKARAPAFKKKEDLDQYWKTIEENVTHKTNIAKKFADDALSAAQNKTNALYKNLPGSKRSILAIVKFITSEAFHIAAIILVIVALYNFYLGVQAARSGFIAKSEQISTTLTNANPDKSTHSKPAPTKRRNPSKGSE